MIIVENVTPTAREMRPIQKGWGLIHLVICLPTYIPILAVIVFGVVVNLLAGDFLPPMLASGFIIGTGVLWWLSSRWTYSVTVAETRKAPVGGLQWRWTIDAQDIFFESLLQSNRLDWRGVKAIREERDRFVFLVSPQHNPVLPTRLLTAEQVEALRALIAQVKAEGRLGRGVD
jgi:hypothetical protein